MDLTTDTFREGLPVAPVALSRASKPCSYLMEHPGASQIFGEVPWVSITDLINPASAHS